uniref:Uncharacterized protein n=1 Tax=Avena sativa TaxID=4498 RepID=A0ACD5WFX2_AVESA
MCSMDHFTGSNHVSSFQPDHQSLPGIMEACDLERHGGGGGGQEADGGEYRSGSSDPRAVLATYLTFLEHKIGHLRGILCSTPSCPHQQHAIVSAELRCIIVQLLSIANDLATGAGASPSADGALGSPSLPNMTHEQPESDDSDHAAADEQAAAGQYEVVQIEKEEILAPHAHTCKVCGKGFKRDANLRMHMRGHGEQYKTPASLARHPSPAPNDALGSSSRRLLYYSCPYAGCKRNRDHRDFQPLKTPVCVKNHYRRTHCDKSHVCRRCGVKRFSVLADLRTHEKHCGLDRWVCSCGTSFSRKDKLYAHVALFDGHTPALPPNHDDHHDMPTGVNHCSTANATPTATVPGSAAELSPALSEAANQCFSGSTFDDFRCSGAPSASMDDGRGQFSSPTGIYMCDFEGFDLLKAVAMDFDF